MSYTGGQLQERLGAPVQIDRPDLESIDPTLDACCQREEELRRKGNTIQRALRRFDVTTERERRRRNVVQTSAFDGCRCCYDPNSDGGEYRTLIELRETRRLQNPDKAHEEAPESLKLDEDEKKELSDDSDDEFDYLLDEDFPGQDEGLKVLEETRRAELEYEMFVREVAGLHGYGCHRQLHPNRVLKAAGLHPSTRDPPRAVVLHLVDPDSVASASLDLCLEILAPKIAGTKFLRSGGRSTLLMDSDLAAKVFPSSLNPDRDMPALIAIRDGCVINTLPRLQGLVDRDGEVIFEEVERWIDRSGVLVTELPSLEEACRIRPEEEALMDYLALQKPKEEECFDCGVPGCQKAFFHEHVGVETEVQSGLVVDESKIVNN